MSDQNLILQLFQSVMNKNPFTLVLFAAVLLMASGLPVTTVAQAPTGLEPEIRMSDSPKSPLDYDMRNGAMLNLMITNFGFGVGGQYRRVLSPMTEGLIELNITAVKDPREQTFFSFWGQQVIPNKFNRVLTFPLMAGFRQRVMASYIEDSFRIYIQGMAGPSLTFIYPYFRDRDFTAEFFQNAQNPDGEPLGVRLSDRDIYDVFGGWGEGELAIGYAGKAAITIDFGRTFNTITSLEFGVSMLYYPDGIQIMEPNSLVIEDGTIVDRVIGGGFSKESWYITPTITLSFGGMW